MEERYITRHEAVLTIYELINSCIISEELEDKLQDIANCIEAEETHNIFLWGADIEAIDLFTAVMNPYQSSKEFRTEENIKRHEDWMEHCNELYEKYRIRSLADD